MREFLAKYVEGVPHVSPDTAQGFLARYNGRKPNTRARYATYLRGFLDHLGPRLNLKVKVPWQLPPFVDHGDIARLRAAIEAKQTHKGCRLRDLTLVDFAEKTGLRRGELANLRVRDINFAESRLKVVGGKGARDRVVPLVPSLLSALQSLCRDKSPGDSVFDLSTRGLGMKFRVWADKAGVDLHTHSFRHYFATTLVERGANLRAVQELLGHSNLNTTQVYVAVTGKHLEAAISLLD